MGVVGGKVRLLWQVEVGERRRLVRNPGLSGRWKLVEEVVGTGNFETKVVNSSGGKEFFRLE